jgi:lipoprotein-anchoring transpeptidase ErfK/SrfK
LRRAAGLAGGGSVFTTIAREVAASRGRFHVGAKLYRSGVVSAGLALLASALSPAPAHAFFWLFGSPSPTYAPPPPSYREPRPLRPRIDHHRQRVLAEKDQPPIAGVPGPLHIVISIANQRLTLYRNGVPVAHAPVSTGVPGHPTPTGVFSVIEKQRFHRSNLYSAAPMPFMQRITWSGVAIHEGVLPGHPASHGCIRIPAAFARQLWSTTRLGARVIISPADVALAEIAHPHLFVPKRPAEPSPPHEVPVADQPARRAQASAVRTAEITDPVTASDAGGLRGAVTEKQRAFAFSMAGAARAVADAAVQSQGAASAVRARVLIHVVEAVQASHRIAVEKKAADRAKRIEALQKAGPISVFVSRKEKKLFVRHKFAPLFEAPVTIREADAPLGTHVYTLMDTPEGAATRWMVVTVPPKSAEVAERPARHGRRSSARAQTAEIPAVAPAPAAAAVAALDRMEIGQETLDRIAELVTPGATLIISDQGLGSETGRGTDFIVVTR